MSTAITCTRAAVPRVTSKAARCRRYAITVTVPAEPSTAPMVPTPNRVTEALSVRMHRMVYPGLYERKDEINWKPKKHMNVISAPTKRVKPKKIDQKWAPVMGQKGVQKNLSTSIQAIELLYISSVTNRVPSNIGIRLPILTTPRPTLRPPHLRPNRLQHQEDLPRPRRSRNRLPNHPPRPHRRTNPPLRKRQPRMRTCRRHPARAPAHRRPLRRRMHQHPAARRRHRYPFTRTAHARGRGDVVQDLQPVGGGHRGGSESGEESETREVDVYAHREA